MSPTPTYTEIVQALTPVSKPYPVYFGDGPNAGKIAHYSDESRAHVRPILVLRGWGFRWGRYALISHLDDFIKLLKACHEKDGPVAREERARQLSSPYYDGAIFAYSAAPNERAFETGAPEDIYAFLHTYCALRVLIQSEAVQMADRLLSETMLNLVNR